MAGLNDKDYYAILGVSQDASVDEIRKSFQSLARKLHPDINKEADAEERFKEVSEAYAVLSDEEKRARYDAMRAYPQYGHHSYANSSPGYTGGYTNTGDFSQWGWPFGGGVSWTGRTSSHTRSRSYNPRAGADVVYRLELDDALAKEGTRRLINFEHYKSCSHCSGVGSVNSLHAKTCPTCSGTGRMRVDLSFMMGFGVMEMSCPECEGTGKVVSDPCPQCHGSGRVLSQDEILVDVPASSHDGDVVRVEGKGNAGTNGSSSGDFLCELVVPSERLTMRQQAGFRLLGFALPFILLSFLTQGAYSISIFMVVLLGYGLYQALSDGIKMNPYFLKNTLRYLLLGFQTGLLPVAFLLMLATCSSGLTYSSLGRP